MARYICAALVGHRGCRCGGLFVALLVRIPGVAGLLCFSAVASGADASALLRGDRGSAGRGTSRWIAGIGEPRGGDVCTRGGVGPHFSAVAGAVFCEGTAQLGFTLGAGSLRVWGLSAAVAHRVDFWAIGKSAAGPCDRSSRAPADRFHAARDWFAASLCRRGLIRKIGGEPDGIPCGSPEVQRRISAIYFLSCSSSARASAP